MSGRLKRGNGGIITGSEQRTNMVEPGQPNAAILRLAFWEAMKRCGDDDRIHDMDYPYHDDPKIDGDIPAELWRHMAAAIQETGARVRHLLVSDISTYLAEKFDISGSAAHAHAQKLVDYVSEISTSFDPT